MKVTRDRSRWRSSLWIFSSWRIKLAAGFVILLLTLLLTSRCATFVAWHRDHEPDALSPRHRYTVVINTWKRDDLLRKSVAHYASCSGLDAIRVVWSESKFPSESLQSALNKYVSTRNAGPHEVELRFDLNDEDDLNNRFKPLEDLATDAVFSVDDDVLIPCSSLEFGFKVWLSAQDSMVGFVPRMHWLQSKNNWKQISQTYRPEHYTYGGWWSIWWTGTYSMVLTKAAFLHHKYFEHYTHQMPAAIRQYVRVERNCEDIAMSFLVANATRAPPIWVKGQLYEIASSGISSLNSHNQQRTVCINHLTGSYGYMPLVSTNAKAVDAHSEWFW